MRKIAVISAAFEIDRTSAQLLARAAEKAEAFALHPSDFRMEEGRLFAGELSLDDLDAAIVRLLDPEGDVDFQFDFIQQLHHLGVRVLNTPRALAIAESKFLTARILTKAGFPMPETIVTQRVEDVLRFLHRYGDVVAKPLYGFQGRDVIRVSSGDEERLVGLVDAYRSVMVQPYIPNPGRDIRGFVVGGRVVAAMYRYAPAGGWKTNIYEGGRTAGAELTPAAKQLCERAAEAIGLDYTGVDLIEGPDGLLVLEVNGSPGWSGLEEATGKDIARSIIELVLNSLESGEETREFNNPQNG